MSTWLHNFHPQPILLSFGPVHIYWYGLFIVLGILAALGISIKLAKYYKIESGTIFDLSFWLIIFGLIGARIYDVLLQLPYYARNPLAIFKVWEGGLAIHGAIIAGLLTIYIFARRQKYSFWMYCSLLVPGLALGQSIGRWGNYFNQELFGRPTNLPWGIPIDLINRPLDYLAADYFHPTFLYESIGCLIISVILSGLNAYFIKKGRLDRRHAVWLVAFYMLSYSILRFSLELIRIDDAPIIAGLRWPQIISLLMALISSCLVIFNLHAQEKKDKI